MQLMELHNDCLELYEQHINEHNHYIDLVRGTSPVILILEKDTNREHEHLKRKFKKTYQVFRLNHSMEHLQLLINYLKTV